MNFYLVTAFSFSILIPGIMALFYINTIDTRYYPFIYCLWLGCVNELLSYALGCHRYQTLVNNNIYVLLESVLLVLYFKATKALYDNRIFDWLLALLIGSWLYENLIFQSITEYCTYFHIGYSVLVVILSLNLINNLLFQNHVNLLKNADFILCLSFIIYFTYKAIIQALTIYGLTNLTFWSKIDDIMVYVNLGVNLLYIVAIIWMRKKANYIFPW